MSWWTGDIRNYSEEEFHGYFSEIRLVAMRTLPRKPPKEILSLLQTTPYHSPYDLAESALATPSSIQGTHEFSYLPETTEFAYSPNHDLRLDLPTPSSVPEDHFSYFPVSARNRLHQWQKYNDHGSPRSSDGGKECSTFKKFAYGIAVYMAIALLALIVIVGILVSSLKTLDSNINELKNGASSLTSSDSAIQGPMQQSAAIPEPASTKDNAIFSSSTQAVTPKITTKANIAPTTKPPPPTTTTRATTTTATQSTTTTTSTKRPTTKTTTTTTTTTTPRPTTTSTASSTTSEPRTTTRLTTKTPTTAPPTTVAPSSDPVLCDDTYCSTLSYEMLGRMNTSVDPCMDFYSYSCGAWISGRKLLLDMNVIDQDRNSVLSDAKLNLKQKIREMLEEGVLFGDSEYLIAAKLHYQSCMDSNTRFDSGQVTDDAKRLLEVFGVDRTLTTWMTPSMMQYTLFSEFGAFGFFTYEIEGAMVGNTKRNILQMNPPELYLRNSVYLYPYEDNQVARRYLDRVVPMIQRFNSHLDSSPSFDDIGRDLRRKIIEVFEFERQISQAIRIAESSNEDKLLYTITDLQRNFPNINWTVALPRQQLSVDIPIQLNFPSYFTSLNGMLGKIERSTLTMYLYIRAILTGILPYAPKATRQFMDNMYQSETAQDYTWIECMDSTLKLLPEEVLVEYSTKYADRIKPVSEYVSSLAANLIDTSLQSFMAYGGYSDSTKFTVSGTLSFLSVVVTPIPIITWTVSLPTSSDVLHLFRANYAAQIYANRLVSRIGEVYSMPFIPWSDVDIVYDKDINTIGISYGTLSWKTNLKPEFSFMSSVGVFLSEKITSAIYGSLDVQSPNTEWSGSSFRHFEGKHDCFSNQLFETRTETGIDKTKRVMSGHAGLYIVIQEQKRLLRNNLIQQYQFPFLALHSEQLFYLSMIQEMCKVDKAEDILSNKLRWNTILMNDNSFIDAFKCPSDSTMNPRYKCHLFQQTNYTIPPTTVAPTTTTKSTTTRPTTTMTTTTTKPTRATTTTTKSTTTTTTAKPTTTTTTAKPTTTTTTTAKPTTTTTTTVKPTTTTTAKPTTTTTTAKPTTTTTTAKPITTTTTAKPTTTTTTTVKPTTTTTAKPTTTSTTAKPTTTTTTAKPTTTATTAKPTTTTITAKPTTTTTTTTTTTKPTSTPSPTTTTTITTTTSMTAASTQTTTEQDTPSTTEFNPFNPDPDTEPPICQSGFCYSLSYSIYSRLDLFADPCEDFYQHACGGWVSGRNTLMELNLYNKSRNSITEDVRYDFREKLLGIVEAKVTDEDSEYLQVIKRHYEACTVSNKIRQVESVTNDMQVLLDVLGMQSDLTSYLGPPLMHSILGADFGGSGVFDYGVIQAVVDQTPTFILQITPSTLYLRSDAYLLPYEDNTIAKRYLERLIPVLQTSNEQLRAPLASEDITDRLVQRLKEVFAFEQELAKALQGDDVFEPYVDVSLIELEQRYPNIDWVYMLPAQQNFAGTPIRVARPSYFQSLDRLFNVTNEDIIAMHIYIKAVLTGVLPYTPLVIRKSMEGIYGNDTSSLFSRGHCLDSVLNLLNKEIHHEYRLQYKEEIQTKTTYYLSLSQRIKETLYNHITSTSDFSDITSERIRAKLTQLKFQFPEEPQISWTVSIFNTPDISFLYRANAAVQVKRYQEFDTIGIPATQSDIAWADTSIRLHSNLNVLGISYPALDFHYAVDPQIPALFTSGWQIARQMITAVMGDFTSTPAMWSTLSLDTLLEKKNCINTQNPGVNSDDVVIGDLIAGGVSLDLVTKIYSDLVSAGDIQKFVLPDPSSIFSMEELIFLTFAQQMCEIDNLSGTPSGQLRVNKILQNDAGFQTAFGCATRSSMNPDQKCHLLSSLATPLD